MGKQHLQADHRKSSQEKHMRKIIAMQLKIGQVDIPRIQIDLGSRDEIPQLLLGLQAIYQNRALRTQVFKLLEQIIPRIIDTGTGRPGMDMWQILVLGTLRLNCNFDYDKLREIANEHNTVRQFLGHTRDEFNQRYALQTLKDNVSLLKPQTLDRINQLVVAYGQRMVKNPADQGLKARCDSFVVETNVHYPTDINLLWDAMRKVITLTGRQCAKLGLSPWRQSGHILRKIKKRFNHVNRLKRSRSKDERKNQQILAAAHQAYLSAAQSCLERVRQTIDILTELGWGNVARLLLIKYFMRHAERQIEQIQCRVLKGQKIAHQDKLFSIFEPHTEWISKGKAGRPQELGLRVGIIEDQYGFILHQQVMEKQTDEQIALPMLIAAKSKFADLASCSFDKGFHSPHNQKALGRLLDQVVLPRKGRLSAEAKAIEHAEDFVAARHQHAAVESAINALENHGLDRCPDHGLNGFKRYVALAVLARNLQILGARIQQKARKRMRLRKEAAGARYRLAA